jgi:hypothetical protein
MSEFILRLTRYHRLRSWHGTPGEANGVQAGEFVGNFAGWCSDRSKGAAEHQKQLKNKVQLVHACNARETLKHVIASKVHS